MKKLLTRQAFALLYFFKHLNGFIFYTYSIYNRDVSVIHPPQPNKTHPLAA